MRLRNNKTTFRDVQETMQYKVHGSLHKHKTIPCPNVCDGRVTKWIINSGYGARIWNPLSRKYQRLGIFKSAEEASMAYLAKKAEFQKLVIVKGKKGTKGVVCDAQTSSKKFVGVTKQTINSGYGARIWNPLSRKRQRLGIFKSAEEASMAYLAKKAEFQKLVKGKKGTQGVVCDEKFKKVIEQKEQCLENQDSGLQVDSRKGWISKGKKKCDMLEKKMVGVSKRKNGKYCARITHPISKKKIWLGTFSSAEEAAMVYLEEKTKLGKETRINEEAIGFVVCKDDGIKKSSDQLGSILQENNHDPCLDYQNSSMEIEPTDSFNGENASGIENLAIQKLEETEGMEWTVSKDNEIRKNTDQFGAVLDQNINEPCSDNQDSLMLIEHNDSLDGESASRMESIIQIQKNEGPAGYEFSTDSSVWSESGAEILLRTESGIPIMDSHGFLLGEWSWIDDLSLPIM